MRADGRRDDGTQLTLALSTAAFPTPFPAPAVKEEHLHDYAARKANIAAAEKAMWDEELGLHK